MLDGGNNPEMSAAATYESLESAIGKYVSTHEGRDIIRWGPLKQPIRIVVKKEGKEIKTFLDLGGADLIAVQGNGDNDVTAAVKQLSSAASSIMTQFKPETIHPSRLALRNLADPSQPSKSVFLVTGELQAKPQATNLK